MTRIGTVSSLAVTTGPQPHLSLGSDRADDCSGTEVDTLTREVAPESSFFSFRRCVKVFRGLPDLCLAEVAAGLVVKVCCYVVLQ